MDSPARKHRTVVDAFGKGSPNRNLPFPDGNLTAAEIVAYCPHWLKSVDIVDRFVNNGGKANSIAVMVNEFRHQPGGGKTTFRANSVTTMIQIAMRGAGFHNWTITSHHSSQGRGEGEWDESELNVVDFRTPGQTHPSRASGKERRNRTADPIQFRDLALHVKKHPTGYDALDLARCVVYALEHPQESWLFPRDFKQLVDEIGGPRQVRPEHFDRQVFERRIPAETWIPPKANQDSSTPGRTPKVVPTALKLMARTRGNGTGDKSAAKSLKRGALNNDNSNTAGLGSVRRSGRLSAKTALNVYKDSSDSTGTDGSNSVGKNLPATKKRKFENNAPVDSEFEQADGSTSSAESIAEGTVDDEDYEPAGAHHTVATGRNHRAAAEKAMENIQTMIGAMQNNVNIPALHLPEIPIDPALLNAARRFDNRVPQLLTPPVLSSDRLVVDDLSVHLYAEPGAQDLYTSALSSTRFGGPRRHPPFRELYRLMDPELTDVSDWAENIRWAKEQERVFGSKTWTEYDYHLEQITQHRRHTLWVSEEYILFGPGVEYESAWEPESSDMTDFFAEFAQTHP